MNESCLQIRDENCDVFYLVFVIIIVIQGRHSAMGRVSARRGVTDNIAVIVCVKEGERIIWHSAELDPHA